jgi:hypothetical protein
MEIAVCSEVIKEATCCRPSEEIRMCRLTTDSYLFYAASVLSLPFA